MGKLIAFQSTPSSRRATDHRPLHKLVEVISIHALLTEGDGLFTVVERRSENISIHALLTEGDHFTNRHWNQLQHFNPRPPHGGRQQVDTHELYIQYISIHALLTEGDPAAQEIAMQTGISIHALLTEGDRIDWRKK